MIREFVELVILDEFDRHSIDIEKTIDSVMPHVMTNTNFDKSVWRIEEEIHRIILDFFSSHEPYWA